MGMEKIVCTGIAHLPQVHHLLICADSYMLEHNNGIAHHHLIAAACLHNEHLKISHWQQRLSAAITASPSHFARSISVLLNDLTVM